LTCAKRQVQCVLVASSGRTYVGTNDCASPQSTCPREPGEDYTKCGTVCHQGAHAEIDALRNSAGVDLCGAIAILRGHYWMCKDCGEELYKAGIRTVVIQMEKP
jgi:deoxycytidylate deaminase